MNWKVRFQNKTTLLAFITCVCTFVYQALSIIGVTVPLSQDMILQLVGVALNVLVGIGVLVDPTTKGIKDSQRAMGYEEPQ